MTSHPPLPLSPPLAARDHVIKGTSQQWTREGVDPSGNPAAASVRGRAAASALRLLPWAFAFFNSARLLSYLPTLWAIHSQGDTSQHSLITWLSWAGANATMAAWLYEKNGLRLDSAVAINLCNTTMCLATTAVIVAYRW